MKPAVGEILKPAAAGQLAQAGQITLTGDASALDSYGALLDEFDPNFEIVVP